MTRAEAKVRSPSDEELRRITGRAVAEIIPEEEFVRALRSGRRLRLKMGFDPTKPIITLGWAVGLRKLRQLQELGHAVVVIIGDWTARIGDPSGASQTRPMLSEEEVKANSEAILRQFYRVLDPERTEIRRQSEWFDGFSLADVVRLAARFTVAQVLQRDDFAQRFESHRPIGLHELLYPLLQAYDSVAVKADVEFGGTDQKFNILVGRELQGMLQQRPRKFEIYADAGGRYRWRLVASNGQIVASSGESFDSKTNARRAAKNVKAKQCVLLVPLLVGYKGGGEKMSQSLDNYIAIDDPPHDMYGKIMSIPDSLLLDYFELLTDLSDRQIARSRKAVEHGGTQAKGAKMRLAREIVSQFHGKDAARGAEDEFVRLFGPLTLPALPLDMPQLPTATVDAKVHLGLGRKRCNLTRILFETGLVDSVSEGRRLIRQGAIDLVGQSMAGVNILVVDRNRGPKRVNRSIVDIEDGDVFRVGKHRFLRIVDADKQSGNG